MKQQPHPARGEAPLSKEGKFMESMSSRRPRRTHPRPRPCTPHAGPRSSTGRRARNRAAPFGDHTRVGSGRAGEHRRQGRSEGAGDRLGRLLGDRREHGAGAGQSPGQRGLSVQVAGGSRSDAQWRARLVPILRAPARLPSESVGGVGVRHHQGVHPAGGGQGVPGRHQVQEPDPERPPPGVVAVVPVGQPGAEHGVLGHQRTGPVPGGEGA